jgi:type IV pilus assembly protein PilP
VKAAHWLCVALLLGAIPVARGEDESPPPTAEPQTQATDGQANAPAYNPAGRRDPFRPFTLDIRPEARTQLTPLQRYELGQLIVVGTVWEMTPPRAMVEDSVGMGYIVTIGTPIGRNGGVVTAIEPQRIVVEERVLDFYGKEQINRVVMETPKEGTN